MSGDDKKNDKPVIFELFKNNSIKIKKNKLPFEGKSVEIMIGAQVLFVDDDEYIELQYDTEDEYHTLTSEGKELLISALTCVLQRLQKDGTEK